MVSYMPRIVDFAEGTVTFVPPTWAADRQKMELIASRSSDINFTQFEVIIFELFSCYAGSHDVSFTIADLDAYGNIILENDEIKTIEVSLPEKKSTFSEFQSIIERLPQDVVWDLYWELRHSGVAPNWFRRWQDEGELEED